MRDVTDMLKGSFHTYDDANLEITLLLRVLISVVINIHVRFILFSPAKCQALICHHFEYADCKFFFREFSPEFFQKSFFWFLVTLPSVSVSKILEE